MIAHGQVFVQVGSDRQRVLKGINICVSDEELAYVGSG
jgi:hypothetical protein